MVDGQHEADDVDRDPEEVDDVVPEGSLDEGAAGLPGPVVDVGRHAAAQEGRAQVDCDAGEPCKVRLVQYYSTVQYSTVQYSTVQYSKFLSLPNDEYVECDALRTVHQHGQGVLVVLVREDGHVAHHGGQEVHLELRNIFVLFFL